VNGTITAVMPDFCAGCGAFLAGGATQHQPECPMLEIIRQHFGDEAAKQVEETNSFNVRTKHDDPD
jgi:hypothetical protein